MALTHRNIPINCGADSITPGQLRDADLVQLHIRDAIINVGWEDPGSRAHDEEHLCVCVSFWREADDVELCEDWLGSAISDGIDAVLQDNPGVTAPECHINVLRWAKEDATDPPSSSSKEQLLQLLGQAADMLYDAREDLESEDWGSHYNEQLTNWFNSWRKIRDAEGV